MHVFPYVAVNIVATMTVVTAIMNSHGLSNAIQHDSLEEPPQALWIIKLLLLYAVPAKQEPSLTQYHDA